MSLEDSQFTVRAMLDRNPRPSDEVIVVAVDEKSINETGRWPWNRRILGDLIGKLDRADIVALDIVFSERSEPEDDAYLADVIEKNGNVIAGFFFRREASATASEEALSHLEDSAVIRYRLLGEKAGLPEFRFAEVNIPEISSVALSSASFNTVPDIDGLFRRYPVAFLYRGHIMPPLALQALRYRFNRDIELDLNEEGVKEFRLGNYTLKESNDLRLNFYQEVNEVSAHDILTGRIGPEFFKGKVVIIGITEIGVYDVRPTPVDTVTPGLYLHFTAVSNMLNNELLRSSGTVDISLILLSILFAALFSTPKKIYVRMLLYSALALSLLVLVYTLFITLNLWVSITLPVLALLALYSTSELLVFLKTESESAEIRKAFSSYVSPDIVKSIIKDPESLKLGGEEREVTVLFSDIRGFTTLSEKLPPERLVYLLNNILDPLTECIIRNRGLLDKYIGDAIMSLFNAPVSLENHADMAALSAIQMQTILDGVNRRMEKEGLPAVRMGVGIHSGRATVGNIGSRLRFEYTAIGDTVNLASRLEGLTKAYKVGIIMSESTRERLKGDFLARKLDVVRVKGKEIPLTIYELMETNDRNSAVRNRFEEAFECYTRKDFEVAHSTFKEIYEELGDKTSYIFSERCLYYVENLPGDNWDGVYEHKAK